MKDNKPKGSKIFCIGDLTSSLCNIGYFPHRILGSVMILNFRTDRSGQTVQTQIRLQSDQGLHCLLFHLHVFDKIPSGLASLFEF